MNAEEIIEQLEKSRERLLVSLEDLPDEVLTARGVMGDWTIADILAHLIAWESELVTALNQIDRDREPVKLLAAYKNIDGFNARRFQENKDRDLDNIFDDLQGVRLQLEQWLESFSENDLNNPDRFGWAKGKPLWRFIEENSFGHELEHLPDIETFATNWQAKKDTNN